MKELFALFILLLFAIKTAAQPEYQDYRERKIFHEYFCKKHPEKTTCNKPYTIETYERERDDELQRSSTWVDEDTAYERRLYATYLRVKARKNGGQTKKKIIVITEGSGSSEEDARHIHVHSSPAPVRVRPSIYPSYPSAYTGYSYPYNYGGYGNSGYGGYGEGWYPGYGSGGYGGGGGLFNLGWSNGLGVGTPIGNFGIGSGFGIGIG